MTILHVPAEPVYPVALSAFQKLKYAIQIRLFKFMVKSFFRFYNLPGLRNKTNDPTYIKTYPCQPKLKNRVFIPDSYEKGGAPLPLYIDIHGGGFCICDPDSDDIFCRPFADRNRVLVVSLDYPKAPEGPFPAAVHALTDLVKAVLQDETLSFDKNKVAIGGFSAGGNLSLAVSQDKSLRDKIGGVVSFYPVADFTTSIAENIAARPEYAPPDPLEHMAPLFNASYFARDQDLRDPQLSVAFTPRENLPAKLYIIGCELDMLCKDAEIMAEHFAGEGEKTGTDIVWEKNGVKWEKIMGFEHGFDLTPTTGETKIRNDERAEVMYDGAAEWLFREIYVS